MVALQAQVASQLDLCPLRRELARTQAEEQALDERVAGFVALGIGKATGVPAALVCTSGSAVAHYLPAVIEASQAEVALMSAPGVPITHYICPQVWAWGRWRVSKLRRLTDLGYIDIRYPPDNDQGVRFEPWHIKAVKHI